MKLVLLGPPGSGKGTQAVMLSQKLGLSHLSSGDLLRQAVAAGSQLGKKAQAYMEKGALVPDEVVIGLILEKIDQGGAGFILDGFPRTLAQARALDGALSAKGQKVDQAINIEVGSEAVVCRLSGRWTCRACQAPYNIPSSPPHQQGKCDRCGGELYQRPDDQPQTVRQRLEVYLSQTTPLIDYYQRQGKLSPVNGEREPQGVLKDILQALGVKAL